MSGNDLSLSAAKLFERLNIKKSAQENSEVLDKGEVALANSRGFSIFKLDDNMTQEDFEKAYNVAHDAAKSENQEEAFNEKIKEVHIKYIQKQYGLDESIRPNEDESLEDFESRIAQSYRGKASIWLEKEAALALLKTEQDEALLLLEKNIQTQIELHETVLRTPEYKKLSKHNKESVLDYFNKCLAEINETTKEEDIETIKARLKIYIVELYHYQEHLKEWQEETLRQTPKFE